WATADSIAATGFLVAGPFDVAGNSSASALLKARIRKEELEDVITTVSQTFLSMTMNCARCHDHKFDPIPQRDYYQIKAALAGVRHGERSLLSVTEGNARQTRVAQLNERIHQLEKEIAGTSNILAQAMTIEQRRQRERLLADLAQERKTLQALPSI